MEAPSRMDDTEDGCGRPCHATDYWMVRLQDSRRSHIVMTTTGWTLITNFERGGITHPGLEGLGAKVIPLGYNSHSCCEKPTAMKDDKWPWGERGQRTAFRRAIVLVNDGPEYRNSTRQST